MHIYCYLMLCISDLIMITTTTTSPIIIPVSSVVHVLGKNYDESIVLTSKYNQSLLRDRRVRQSNVFDNQTGIRQMNCSLYHKISDRLNITRTDQVYVYPRRIYRRQIRHNPYLLTVSIDQRNVKIENDVSNELTDSFEQKSNENIKCENLTEIIHDQVVIPNEQIQSNKERIMMNMNYQKKLKNKNQSESEQNEYNNRRHYSKSESLLVSLLKQEAIGEKKQDIPLIKTPSITKPTNQKFDDDIVYDSSIVQVKLDKKDPDFVVKKQKIPKKSSKSISSLQSQSKSICTMCGETNMINDELIRCSTCQKSMHAYKCLNFENNNIVKTIKTYSWQCIDCKKCIQCGTVEHDDELLFCDYCDRAYHMDCLKPPLNEPPPGAWYCQLCT